MMAISEKRFPFEMGQLTVISSFGLAQALSLVMQRLKPLSSRKQTCALLSQSARYWVQQSCRFQSDFVVFLSLGTHLTLFFLNFPTFSSRATVVRVISTFSPSFVNFKSSILLSSTVNSFCVRKGFSLMSLATCSNLSSVILRSGIFFLISRLKRSEKDASSIHSAYSLVMVLQFILKICPISLMEIFVPFSLQLLSCAQYSSNLFFSSQSVFLVSFFLLPDLPRFLPIGYSSSSLTYRFSFLAIAYQFFNSCFILFAYCFIYFRFSRIASPTSVFAILSQVLPEYCDSSQS